jgi:hypothetical protein
MPGLVEEVLITPQLLHIRITPKPAKPSGEAVPAAVHDRGGVPPGSESFHVLKNPSPNPETLTPKPLNP